MDQHRMIDDILKELNVTGAKGERLPYPMDLPKLSRLDNASVSEQDECRKCPYRRVVGQLMYGMYTLCYLLLFLFLQILYQSNQLFYVCVCYNSLLISILTINILTVQIDVTNYSYLFTS